jgi:large subunit ribosomal protein L5
MSGQIMPRLKKYYVKELVPKLRQELGVKNVMQVPSLKKIVINMGLGESVQNPKAIDSGCEMLRMV